jgi:hypothetical protein
MAFVQPVDKDYLYRAGVSQVFNMIENYIYLYHTKTLIAIPTYPEEITDTMGITYNTTTPLSRSAPIYSYSNSGPRSFALTLNLHRDMMKSINTTASNLNVADLGKDDYVDILAKQLQAIALPKYAASEKMVNPPMIAVRFGNELFCKGVVQGAVSVKYSGPILRNDKYALVTIDFTVNEVDPYDAETVMQVGSFRGLSQDLERNIYKKK